MMNFKIKKKNHNQNLNIKLTIFTAVGTLKVLLRTGFGKNLQEIVLFTMSGNQGENWKYGKFNIPTCTKKFQVHEYLAYVCFIS